MKGEVTKQDNYNGGDGGLVRRQKAALYTKMPRWKCSVVFKVAGQRVNQC